VWYIRTPLLLVSRSLFFHFPFSLPTGIIHGRIVSAAVDDALGFYILSRFPQQLCLLRLFRPAVIYSSSLGQLLPRSSSSFSKRYEAAKLDGPKYPANGLKKRGFSLHLSRSRLFCFVLPNDGRELVTFLYTANGGLWMAKVLK
jgi:hypothetical protein